MRSALRHLLAALALGLCGCSAPTAELDAGAGTARVVRVVDGDTIRVSLHSGEETIRYIGIDTPESVKPGSPVECFAKAASAFNTRLVRGRRGAVQLVPEERDRHGRLPAIVPPPGGRVEEARGGEQVSTRGLARS